MLAGIKQSQSGALKRSELAMPMFRSKSTAKGNLPLAANNSGLDTTAKSLLNQFSTIGNTSSSALAGSAANLTTQSTNVGVNPTA